MVRRYPFITVASQFADPQMRASWVRDKGLKMFSFQRSEGSLEELDVLLESSRDYVLLGIASIDALIEMRSGTGRAQDVSDVDALQRLKAALSDG